MMSSVVGGTMLPHAPQFFRRPETEDRDTVEQASSLVANFIGACRASAGSRSAQSLQ